jgi:hypothetical protein
VKDSFIRLTVAASGNAPALKWCFGVFGIYRRVTVSAIRDDTTVRAYVTGEYSPDHGDGHPSTRSRKSDSRRSGAPGLCDSQRWACRHLDGRDLIVTF